MNTPSKSDQLLTLLNELIPSYEKSANELHDKSVLLTQLAAEAMKEANDLRKLVSMLRLTIHDHITQSKVDQITKSVQQHHESEKVQIFEEVPVAPNASAPQVVTITPNESYSHARMNERTDMSNVSLTNHTHAPDAPNPVKTSSPTQVMNHETMDYEVVKEKLLDEFEAGTVTSSVMDLPIDMIETMPNVNFSK